MSARALQRVVVRMLHDTSLVTAVYEDAEAALQGAELTSAERGLLLRTDQRVWLLDPERPSRVFEAIRTEYPISCALAEVASGGRSGMLRFFSSRLFHEAVQQRGTIALAFGIWLEAEARDGRLGRKTTAATALLEGACARVRRGPVAEVQTGVIPQRLRTAPWLEFLRLPEGTVELFEAVRETLDAGRPLGRIRLPGRGVECAVVEASAVQGGLKVGLLPEGLTAMLEAAVPGIDSEALIAEVVSLGLPEDEAERVVESAYHDGLLSSSGSPSSPE